LTDRRTLERLILLLVGYAARHLLPTRLAIL
jgi:hypothetical protein